MDTYRKRFPTDVSSVDDLPGPVQAAVRQSQPDRLIRQIINIPAHDYLIQRHLWWFSLPFGWRRTPERVLVFGEDRITVVEPDKQGVPTPITIPLAALIELRLFRVLLYSYVEFTWAEGAHAQSMRIEFNAVGDRLIQKGIDRIRAALPPLAEPDTPPEFRLTGFPFKFRSYLRDSVLPGEAVLAVAYQPAIRQGTGRFSPYLSPNRAVALTDRCLITIEDRYHTARFEGVTEADYSMDRRFLPLRQVAQVVTEPAGDITWLKVRSSTDYDMTIPLAPAAASTLETAFRTCALAQRV